MWKRSVSKNSYVSLVYLLLMLENEFYSRKRIWKSINSEKVFLNKIAVTHNPAIYWKKILPKDVATNHVWSFVFLSRLHRWIAFLLILNDIPQGWIAFEKPNILLCCWIFPKFPVSVSECFHDVLVRKKDFPSELQKDLSGWKMCYHLRHSRYHHRWIHSILSHKLFD